MKTTKSVFIGLTVLAFLLPVGRAQAWTLCTAQGCVPVDGTTAAFVAGGIALSIIDSRIDVGKGQKGSGKNIKPARLSVSKDKPSLNIKIPGRIKRTSGKGEWTQIREANIVLTSNTENGGKGKLITTGEWTNGSRHAHWQGNYSLNLKGKDGKEFNFYLLRENHWIDPWTKKTWVTDTTVPNGFWVWARTQDPQATVYVALNRLK